MAKELKSKPISSMEDGKYRTWSKSSRNNDWTKEIRVDEIENGFLVSLEEYGNVGGDYKHKCRKYFTKENPLSEDDLKMDEGLDEAINEFVDSI